MITRWSSVLLIIMLLLATGCAAEPPPQVRSLGRPELSDPTSVVLAYRTPQPTLTLSPTPVTPTPTMDFDPDYVFGSMLVTLDDVGKIVRLRRGEDFVLTLGDAYQWQVEIDPQERISLNRKITPQPGDQGVFVARNRGEAVLRAVGIPACRQADPPCARPDLLFQVFIVVE